MGTYSWLVLGSTVTAVGVAPTNPVVGTLSSSTIQVTWTSPGPAYFDVEASTANDFSGTLITTATTNTSATQLTAGAGALPLSVDTTYYLRVGALYGGTTAYSATIATATLTDVVQNALAFQINSTSITVNWTALSSTAQGYVLQASSASDFSSAVTSSQTLNVELEHADSAGLDTDQSPIICAWVESTLEWGR